MKINKKFIIIGVAVAVIIGALLLLLPDNSDDSLSTQLGTATGFGASTDIIQSEAIFLSQIQQLQGVDLSNVSLFTDDRFSRLVDNTVLLNSAKAGRPNPYAPIDARVRVEQQEKQKAAAEAAATNQAVTTDGQTNAETNPASNPQNFNNVIPIINNQTAPPPANNADRTTSQSQIDAS